MQHDFIAELRALIEDIHYGLIPGATIERLQDIAGRMEAEQEAAKAVADTPPTPAVAMSERVANLEAYMDATDASNAAILDRLYALSVAMREVAKKESLHPSVRFLADTIALNLAAPTVPAELPSGYEVVWSRREGSFGAAIGYWWKHGREWSATHYDSDSAAISAAWDHSKKEEPRV